MADLGRKRETLYPSCCDESDGKDDIIYPDVSLPLDFADGKDLDLGDEYEFTFKGKITRVEKSEFSKDFTAEFRSGTMKKSE